MRWLTAGLPFLFRSRDRQANFPENLTVQAIGDVHGCSNLLDPLLEKLRQEIPSGHNQKLIFLGDLIDRGPNSAGVIQSVITEKGDSNNSSSVVTLRGNHEQLLLDFLHSPEDCADRWFRNGGIDTLKSYGVFPPLVNTGSKLRYCRDELLQTMPPDHLQLIKAMPLCHTVGDFFFCHAAVNPERALNRQLERDLLWSRSTDYLDENRIEKIVVHGHVPVREAHWKVGHVNVDTGAYATGVLTALQINVTGHKFVTVSL